MNVCRFDEEMFDDLHEGVEALRAATQSRSISLSPKAVETLQRLKNTMPLAKNRFDAWKQALKGRAVKAVQKTDHAVHKHPYSSVIGALTLGIIVGISLTMMGGEETEEST